MTTPHDLGPVIGHESGRGKPGGDPGSGHESPGGGLLTNVRAVVLGIRDTAKDMLQAGQVEAHRAQDEAWARYDALTRYRRQERQRREAEEAERER
ncbi:MAG: hypothetical protein U5Q44_05495 [Dehalococcoidia bacterium]|nr:hypothetical protein [Dehalococcoidia bacterium]